MFNICFQSTLISAREQTLEQMDLSQGREVPHCQRDNQDPLEKLELFSIKKIAKARHHCKVESGANASADHQQKLEDFNLILTMLFQQVKTVQLLF